MVNSNPFGGFRSREPMADGGDVGHGDKYDWDGYFSSDSEEEGFLDSDWVEGEDDLNHTQGPLLEEESFEVINTSGKDGLNKCVQCGSTEVVFNDESGVLYCEFCRYEWSDGSLGDLGFSSDVASMSGRIVGSGATDIIPSTETVVTFKCGGCGAEIVIDTDEAMQARCHWCRNVLSVNEQIPNGAVPDVVLPFKLSKEEAVHKISEFVEKRKSFANRRFLREFNSSNVMGVYLPYMIFDGNAKVRLKGEGEVLTREYTRGDNNTKYYDADVYNVDWGFNLEVKHLTVEASSTRLDQDVSKNTNNVINAIMPFDTENSVQYNASYLSGYSSEKRDTNIEELSKIVEVQGIDIARHSIIDELVKKYDRGVRWDSESFEFVGEQWVSAYFPVWLYSYQEEDEGKEKLLHYVAVNARTGETMGSVPVSKKRLLAASVIVEILAIIVVGGLLSIVGF